MLSLRRRAFLLSLLGGVHSLTGFHAQTTKANIKQRVTAKQEHARFFFCAWAVGDKPLALAVFLGFRVDKAFNSEAVTFYTRGPSRDDLKDLNPQAQIPKRPHQRP